MDNEQGATNLAWTGVIKKLFLSGCFCLRPGVGRQLSADRLNQSVTWPALCVFGCTGS